MRVKMSCFAAVLTISFMSLAGCGGDGGVFFFPSSASTTTVSKGVITATGSIVVNGLTYNVNSAAINLDGLPGSASGLQPGMVVTVKGVFDNRTSHTFPRTATSVEFADNLEGPVDFVNSFSNALLVMGQPVRVTPTGTLPNTTVLVSFANISSLQPGNVVEVSGFHSSADGFFEATRIELKAQAVSATTPIELKGAISALDPAGKTFMVGSLTVDYSTINPIFLPSPLSNGLFVEVTGLGSDYTTGAAPTLLAAVVKPVTEGVTGPDGQHVSVEGFVSGLLGTTFTVEGTPVNAGAISLAEVANGSKVLVEGTFSSGVVMASKITPF